MLKAPQNLLYTWQTALMLQWLQEGDEEIYCPFYEDEDVMQDLPLAHEWSDLCRIVKQAQKDENIPASQMIFDPCDDNGMFKVTADAFTSNIPDGSRTARLFTGTEVQTLMMRLLALGAEFYDADLMAFTYSASLSMKVHCDGKNRTTEMSLSFDTPHEYTIQMCEEDSSHDDVEICEPPANNSDELESSDTIEFLPEKSFHNGDSSDDDIEVLA